MKREKWPVVKKDTREHKGPGQCGYCESRLGEEHEEHCVCRNRTVVVEVTVRMAYVVPEAWGEEEINGWMNDSNSCKTNLMPHIQELFRFREEVGPLCMCQDMVAEYVDEADEEAEKKYGVSIAEWTGD